MTIGTERARNKRCPGCGDAFLPNDQTAISPRGEMHTICMSNAGMGYLIGFNEWACGPKLPPESAVWCYCFPTPEPSESWLFPDDYHSDVCAFDHEVGKALGHRVRFLDEEPS